jgi:formate hydrogenlyase subunit 4
MIILASIIHVVLALSLSPLLIGVINRVKAKFAGRRGRPLLQLYYDLWKLLHKGAVYSTTTTWVFRTGPLVGISAVLVAISLVPLGRVPALAAFDGDIILLAYVLGLMRFMTVLAALDTGSAFEGMGAGREVQFSLLAEPALLLGVGALSISTGDWSLSGIYGSLFSDGLAAVAPTAVMVAASLLIILLAENSRIPVDDPNTHLELTMIHEVMVLDHGGVDLAFIQYAAALKLWVFCALFVGVALPLQMHWPLVDLAFGMAGVFIVAMVIGVIESTMARLRLLRVPQMLVVSAVLAMIAVLWALR